MLVQVTLTHL